MKKTKYQKEKFITYTYISQILGVDRKTIYNRLKKNGETIERGLLSEEAQRKVFNVMRIPYDDFFSEGGYVKSLLFYLPKIAQFSPTWY